MNKNKVVLSLLASMLLIGCDVGSSSEVIPSSQDSSPEISSSEVSSSPIVSSTPVVSSSPEVSSQASSVSSVDNGPLTVAQRSKRAMPEWKYENGTYTFYLSAEKTGVSLSGTLNGNIVVSGEKITNPDEVGNMSLELAGVTINASTTAIFYSHDTKKLVLDIADGTENVITTTGDNEESAVESTHNVEVSGKGTVKFSSKTGHGIKCDDLTFNAKTKITVDGTGKDGLHCKNLFLLDDDDAAFKGSLTLKNIAKQAIDVADYDKASQVASGSITWSTENVAITIDTADAVFNLDNNTSIPANVIITATNVSLNEGTPVVARKENKNLTVTVTAAVGSLTVNGTAFTTFDAIK